MGEDRTAGPWTAQLARQIPDEPRVQVGSSSDGDAVLYDIVGAVMLSDGRIVVANRGTSEVLFFAPDGNFLFAAGGPGDGPGAFRSLATLGAGSGDTLFTYDDRTGRISVFNADGALLRTRRIDISSALPAGFDFGPGLQAAGWTPSGDLVAFRRLLRSTPSERDSSDSFGRARTLATSSEFLRFRQPTVELLSFNREGRLVSRIGELKGSESLFVNQVQDRRDDGGSGTISMTSSLLDLPFLKTFQANAAWGAVAFGNTSDYEIRVTDASGDMMYTVRRARAAKTVTTSERNAWIQGQLSVISDPELRGRRRRLYDGIEFPTTMPAFSSLALQEGGALWVEEFDSGMARRGRTRWGVYDAGGTHLGDVTMPARLRPMSIGRDYLLGVWKDELDVEYVRVYDVMRPSGG